MCLTTLYDSPTCGHTWLSLSTPCSFLSDLLSCTVRSTYQTLIAPPYTCPVCNSGFADAETIEMVQGPWGCNQLIRGHVGGSYAIPGQWGTVPLSVRGGWGMGGMGGPALTSGYASGYGSAMAGPLPGCGSGVTYDHRLTGPYGPGGMGGGAPLMLTNGPAVVYDDCGGFDSGGYFDDGCFEDRYLLDDYTWGGGCGRREKKSRQKSKYKYRYTDRPSTNCAVM